jgi:hypothetical protein
MKVEYGAGSLIVPSLLQGGVYLTPYKQDIGTLRVGKTYFLPNEMYAKELLGYEEDDAA